MDLENNGKKQEKVPESLYRFLLTIARRKGIDDIRIRMIMASGGDVALIKRKNGEGTFCHLLPHCFVNDEADGKDVENAIRDAVEETGMDVLCVDRYLGSRDCISENGANAKCFDFRVLVKRKRSRDIKWVGKNDINGLSISEDEKKVLKTYFYGVSRKD